MMTFWAKVKKSFSCKSFYGFYFLDNFWKKLGYFYFNLWSHCSERIGFAVIVFAFSPFRLCTNISCSCFKMNNSTLNGILIATSLGVYLYISFSSFVE